MGPPRDVSSQNQVNSFVSAQSTGSDGLTGQSNAMLWGLEDLLEFPENVEAQNGLIPVGDHDAGAGCDWQKWGVGFMSVDDNIDSNWSEILADVDAPTLEPKVCSFLIICIEIRI